LSALSKLKAATGGASSIAASAGDQRVELFDNRRTRLTRGSSKIITAEEADQRAKDLFASAELLPPGNSRTAVLKEACGYRTFAEMKRMTQPLPKNSNPAG
jgi:hypothetical protein